MKRKNPQSKRREVQVGEKGVVGGDVCEDVCVSAALLLLHMHVRHPLCLEALQWWWWW